MSVDIQWDEPTTTAYRGGRQDFFEALAKRPGKWAVFSEGKTRYFPNQAYHKKRYPNLEFTCRRQLDGTYKTWVRFRRKGSK